MPRIRVLLSIIWILALAACADRSAEGPAPIRIGYIPISDNAQMYVAIEQGYFQQEGLNVELRSMSGGPRIIEALVSMGSEKIDIGYSNVVSIIAARAQGFPVVAIAGGPIETPGRPTHAVLVRADSAIKSVKDLQGKTLAVNALRNIDHIMLLRYLEAGGVDTAGIKLVEVPFPQMENVLLTSTVDAAATIEPFMTFALKRDSIRVLDHHYAVVEPRTVVGSYLTTEQWLGSNQDSARRFVAALGKATEFIRSDQQATRRMLVKYTQVDAETTAAMQLTEFQEQHQASDIQRWIEEMVRWKMISAPVEVSAVFRGF